MSQSRAGHLCLFPKHSNKICLFSALLQLCGILRILCPLCWKGWLHWKSDYCQLCAVCYSFFRLSRLLVHLCRTLYRQWVHSYGWRQIRFFVFFYFCSKRWFPQQISFLGLGLSSISFFRPLDSYSSRLCIWRHSYYLQIPSDYLLQISYRWDPQAKPSWERIQYPIDRVHLNHCTQMYKLIHQLSGQQNADHHKPP